MKAILVIDKPVNCWQCPCYSDYDCNVLNECIFDDYGNPRNIQCPLKPMPSKRKNPITKTFGTPFNKGQVQGWNDCIDKITGETE